MGNVARVGVLIHHEQPDCGRDNGYCVVSPARVWLPPWNKNGKPSLAYSTPIDHIFRDLV